MSASATTATSPRAATWARSSPTRWAAGARGAARHPHQLARRRCWPAAQPAESEQERAAADAGSPRSGQSGFGYFLEMATRPQTRLRPADSPVALAAWMLDHDTDSYYKISRAFVDGEPVGNLTRDEILDNITLYWLTGTGASAARSYWEDGQALARALASGQAPPEVSRPGRLHASSPARSTGPRAAGSRGLPQPHLLQRGRQGRPLRRLGGAGALLDRGPGRVQVTALANERRSS